MVLTTQKTRVFDTAVRTHPSRAMRVTFSEPYQGLCTLLVHTAGVLGGPHTERRQRAREGESCCRLIPPHDATVDIASGADLKLAVFQG